VADTETVVLVEATGSRKLGIKGLLSLLEGEGVLGLSEGKAATVGTGATMGVGAGGGRLVGKRIE
jgi:hypothetical protein